MLVIKVKDILKYLASGLLIILIITLCTRYFFSKNKVIDNKEKKSITKTALVNCMSSVIPNISEVNEDKNIEKSTIIEKILNTEIGYIKTVKDDTQSETIANEKKLEDAKTGLRNRSNR